MVDDCRLVIANESHQFALLAFKDEITQLDPLGTLSSWNNSLHFCEWRGVTCSRRHRSRVTKLQLPSQSLVGSISPHVGNLSFLKVLNLANNSFNGEIPQQVGHLFRLQSLNLSANLLEGQIPVNLSHCIDLIGLRLYKNMLVGRIPDELGSLSKLISLVLGENNLSGEIPPSLGNLSSLNFLGLGFNSLEGSIPSALSRLPSLKYLFLGDNNLSGMVPLSLYNLSSLEYFGLMRNQLQGSFPFDIGLELPNLNDFSVFQNKFTGHSKYPESCGFKTRLGLQRNMFTGSIPTGIGKLKNLGVFTLYENKLSGQIPSSFGDLTRLSELYLASNNLTGKIPSSLGNCKSLQLLELYENKLSGTIPEQVIGLSSLSRTLNLANNSLTGSIPVEVGKLKNLGELILSENKLSGEIPSTLGDCSSLEILQMESNFFQGSIPQSLSYLKGLEDLSLARNNLSGKIPEDLQNISALLRLDLSFNNLEGEVPREGVFKNLSAISVEGNSRLCGGVPELQLPNCPIQSVPKKQRRSLSFKVIIIIIVIAVLCLILIVFFLTLYWRKNKSKTKLPSKSFNIGNQYLGVSYNELLNATNGFGSTNLLGVGSFGSVYKGVLREDEKLVAVKVLNLQQRGATKSFMAECDALRKVRHRNLLKIITCCSSVDNQGNDFKALVFEFMANGSLENWLHPISNVDDQLRWRNLSLEQRLNIAMDVASALDYLHHHCQTPIVHCDLKPSNVLLDDDLIAHVGDFGLAKFLSKPSSYSGQNDKSSSIAIKGSIGYVAPEYGMGGEVSTQGDVYSYGILLLEMFTGKRSTDDILKDGLSLHNFSKMALPLRVLEIVDSRLLLEAEGDDADEAINHNVNNMRRNITRDKMQETLASIIQIGVICSSELPSERISMKEVTVKLQGVKDLLLGVGM
ncbi:Protein kinase domain [Macleaya cordata]|uniref:non-specific serine/threonine protein kinase n=1 Tax=Macleaya cordata TaxID=56857 RepID=A0A200QFI6_MACCD|nr:Protein kinase domain [Macleaya cordata]